eukprot:5345032-Pleurochrysis_carterae.AAC.5
MRLKLAVAATMVAPRPATLRAHDYTVRTEAERSLDHGAAMRYKSTQQEPRRKRARNAKTCKCE